MIIKAENKVELRDECIQHVKNNGFGRVLDVGGAMFPWAREVVTHYLDIKNPQDMCGPEFDCEQFAKSEFIQGDICRQETWDDLERSYKPFDFAICTQTLEDLRDPTIALRNLPYVAKAGFIAVPSKYRELSFVEGHGATEQREWSLRGKYRGYFHHRWVFTIDEGKLRLFPKLAFVECLAGLEDVFDKVDQYKELSFFWDKNIPFEVVNDDFLGPNPLSVFTMYRNLLRRGL